MLEIRGVKNIDRFDRKCSLDHESDLKSYKEDLEAFLEAFKIGNSNEVELKSHLFTIGELLIQSVIDTIDYYILLVDKGKIKEADAENIIIGQGHHRVFAISP